jgi:hypothetical protein
VCSKLGRYYDLRHFFFFSELEVVTGEGRVEVGAEDVRGWAAEDEDEDEEGVGGGSCFTPFPPEPPVSIDSRSDVLVVDMGLIGSSFISSTSGERKTEAVTQVEKEIREEGVSHLRLRHMWIS